MTYMKAVTRPKSLREEALGKIRDAIVFGDLPAGELFSEQAIATQLQISRTPVREALLQLGSEGLIEFVPNRGARIAPLSGEYLARTFEMRASIEGYCGRQLSKMENIDDVICTLRQILGEQHEIIESNDRIAWVASNMRFHMLLVEQYGNPLMIDVMKNLTAHTMRMGYQVNERASDRRRQSLSEHTLIVDAIEARRPDLVVERIEGHLVATNRLVETLVGSTTEHIDAR